MYRFYFKIKDSTGCIISISNVISKNSTIAYSSMKARYGKLKPVLTTRKNVIF